MLNHDTSTVIAVPSDSAQSGVSEMLTQGGVAVAVILSLVLLIKALAELVKACQD